MVNLQKVSCRFKVNFSSCLIWIKLPSYFNCLVTNYFQRKATFSCCFLFSFFDRMDKMEKGGGSSLNEGNDAPYCRTSVINLSCHQKDVHGMTKMKRKLDAYFTGVKKTP